MNASASRVLLSIADKGEEWRNDSLKITLAGLRVARNKVAAEETADVVLPPWEEISVTAAGTDKVGA